MTTAANRRCHARRKAREESVVAGISTLRDHLHDLIDGRDALTNQEEEVAALLIYGTCGITSEIRERRKLLNQQTREDAVRGVEIREFSFDRTDLSYTARSA